MYKTMKWFTIQQCRDNNSDATQAQRLQSHTHFYRGVTAKQQLCDSKNKDRPEDIVASKEMTILTNKLFALVHSTQVQVSYT